MDEVLAKALAREDAAAKMAQQERLAAEAHACMSQQAAMREEVAAQRAQQERLAAEAHACVSKQAAVQAARCLAWTQQCATVSREHEQQQQQQSDAPKMQQQSKSAPKSAGNWKHKNKPQPKNCHTNPGQNMRDGRRFKEIMQKNESLKAACKEAEGRAAEAEAKNKESWAVCFSLHCESAFKQFTLKHRLLSNHSFLQGWSQQKIEASLGVSISLQELQERVAKTAELMKKECKSGKDTLEKLMKQHEECKKELKEKIQKLEARKKDLKERISALEAQNAKMKEALTNEQKEAEEQKAVKEKVHRNEDEQKKAAKRQKTEGPAKKWSERLQWVDDLALISSKHTGSKAVTSHMQ